MKWEYRTAMFEASGWLQASKLDGKKFNDRLDQLGGGRLGTAERFRYEQRA
jgi:hypothetical protein